MGGHQRQNTNASMGANVAYLEGNSQKSMTTGTIRHSTMHNEGESLGARTGVLGGLIDVRPKVLHQMGAQEMKKQGGK